MGPDQITPCSDDGYEEDVGHERRHSELKNDINLEIGQNKKQLRQYNYYLWFSFWGRN